MKTLLAALAIATSFALPIQAQETASPAVLDEIAMSEHLIALGQARGEPVLVLAGIRLRATLGGAAAAPGDALTSREDAFALAKELAAGDPSLTDVITDAETETSRRMPICGPLWCY
ncbi:hypothetical protein [Oceaniglobus ichthyenteri]|uniref:hypothetical protein n=1 Tax=Oceaniglobus ichthyenteri TaxID=2136177 RepID=UPI000D344EF6|nr:hypothetical protein [Oceaniglobus ichthyenteri]